MGPVYQPRGRRTKCLAELRHVAWNELPHAYLAGPPPPDDLLRALASDDDETATEAHDELIGSIWHQGTIYEATVHAVPFSSRCPMLARASCKTARTTSSC